MRAALAKHDLAPSRRELLSGSGSGLGFIALAWLMARRAQATPSSGRPSHFAPRASRVVQIYAAGGMSQVDTFDYKPDLAIHHGQELSGKGRVDTFFGQPGRLMKSPFAFRQYGQSGRWVSDLFPALSGCVDQIAFIHSMVAKSNNHTPAAFQMNSGFAANGFPCMGAWVSYGLGSENDQLPTFVVLPDPRGLPAGGSINWSAGFLPASHQGVAFRTGAAAPMGDLATPAGTAPEARKKALAHLQRLNADFAKSHPGAAQLEARVRSYELAARMQVSVPEAVDFSDEPAHIRSLYGLDEPVSAGFGRNCLMARRMLERGVRFVQLFNGGAFGMINGRRINWDGHEDIVTNHRDQAAVLDRPLAGLLQDLKQRGLLEDTLVVFSSEFGRTPFTQGLNAPGRDHHQHGFTSWLAGAGVRPGIAYGSTDEVGYHARDGIVSVHDFHATILHLLGLDHKKLTYYHNGIQRRLTDVHGDVVTGVLA